MKKNVGVLCLFALIAKFSFSQDVDLRIVAPNNVAIGEQFTVEYSINRAVDNISIISFEHFKLISGPSQSTSSSISIVNGEIKKDFKKVYSYVIEPLQTGMCALPIASVNIDSLMFITDTVFVKVSEKINNKIQNDSIISDNLFIDLSYSKKDVYIQEPFIAVLKLYSNLSIGEIKELTLPSFDNFLKYNIELPSSIEFVKEQKNGKMYNSAIIAKFLLCPQLSGELNLEGAKVKCTINNPSKSASKGLFDDFFKAYNFEEKTIETSPTKINVKPFPKENLSNASGICGKNIKLSVASDKSDIYINKPFNYEITLTGTGNLKMILNPKIILPQGLLLESRNDKNNITITENGISGSRTFVYTIIPEKQGEFIIPSFSISYFDLDSLKEKTVSTLATIINVKDEIIDSISVKKNISENNKLLHNKNCKNDILIAVDVSASMLAQDLKPNRLSSAVDATIEFVKKERGRFGLVFFSELAKVQCPLGTPKSIIIDSLKNAANVKYGNGTATGFGLGLGISEIIKSNSDYKTIILLTDGNTNSGSITGKMAANLANIYGVRIHVIGVCGKEENALYPVITPSGMQMMTVPVSIDEQELKAISEITNGLYFRALDSVTFINSYKQIKKQIKKKQKQFFITNSEINSEGILNVLHQDILDIEQKIEGDKENKK